MKALYIRFVFFVLLSGAGFAGLGTPFGSMLYYRIMLGLVVFTAVIEGLLIRKERKRMKNQD